MKDDKQIISLKYKRIIVFVGIALFLILSAVVGYYIGRPMIKFIDDHDKFREWVDSSGVGGRLAFIGMMILQIIIALIPGEPLELAAGYAFGAVEGTILCLAGALIGSVAVFMFVRKVGMKAVTLFFPEEKIQKLKFLHYSKRRNFWIFIIFFIPGTPKDLLSYVVGLTDIKLSHWILITSVARIPSIVTSTVAADALGMQNYVFAIIVFASTFAVSAAGVLIYRLICKIHEEKHDK